MISAIRGTHDILPGEVEKWQYVERVARALCDRSGYVEVRTPVIEREELFSKGTGETTDIVQKVMYSFADKGGDRITLRPEATPSMVRAFVEPAGKPQHCPSRAIFLAYGMTRKLAWQSLSGFALWLLRNYSDKTWLLRKPLP